MSAERELMLEPIDNGQGDHTLAILRADGALVLVPDGGNAAGCDMVLDARQVEALIGWLHPVYLEDGG